MAAEEEPPVSYEQLAQIEDEFQDIDTKTMRFQYNESKRLYESRQEVTSKIEHFWPLVLEQAPPEVDQFILPADMQVFAESLTSIAVSRPELDADPAHGNPRSLKIRFEFDPAKNDRFEDAVLEKEFWHRRADDGYSGLVSKPVKINWKKGKDLSQGMTDLAVRLFEERAKLGDHKSKEGETYKELKKKVEVLNGASTTFFTWFGWVSDRRWIGEEEDARASKQFADIKARRQNGEEVEGHEPEDEEHDDEEVEVHEAGEMLAITIAEDLWPKAIEYFTNAQEVEEISDAEFEDDEEEDEDTEAQMDIKAELAKLSSAKKKRAGEDLSSTAKKQQK